MSDSNDSILFDAQYFRSRAAVRRQEGVDARNMGASTRVLDALQARADECELLAAIAAAEAKTTGDPETCGCSSCVKWRERIANDRGRPTSPRHPEGCLCHRCREEPEGLDACAPPFLDPREIQRLVGLFALDLYWATRGDIDSDRAAQAARDLALDMLGETLVREAERHGGSLP